MPVVDFEVVELVDDLLPGLPGEEFRVLHHGGIDFFERIAVGHGAKVVEEPLTPAVVIGIEIPSATGRLKGFFAQGFASPAP